MPSGLQGRRDVSMWEPVQGFADMMAGALRGSMRGTFGLPGDLVENAPASTGSPVIDALLALARKSDLPTSKSLHKLLPPLRPDKPGAEPSMMEEIGQFLPSPAAVPVGTAKALGRTAQELATPAMISALHRTAPAAEPLNIVRRPGGNFLKGALPEQPADEVYSPEVQKVLDKKLGDYFRTEFGSTKDPLRVIQDSGVGQQIKRDIGVRDDVFPSNYDAKIEESSNIGVPGHWSNQHRYLANEQRANTWDVLTGENLTVLDDPKIAQRLADILKQHPKAQTRMDTFTGMPELDRALLTSARFTNKDIEQFENLIPFTTPDTPLVFPNKGVAGGKYDDAFSSIRKSLGGYMEKAKNPEAVRAEDPLLYEYMKNNKLFLAEKDINQGSLPALFIKSKAYNAWMDSPVNPESAIRKAVEPISTAPGWHKYNPDSPDLARGLKTEGDIQSHCIGGYCEPVKEGSSSVYSYRRGDQPHMALELENNNWGTGQINQIFRAANQMPMDHDLPAVQSLIDHLRSGNQLNAARNPRLDYQFDARKLRDQLIRRQEEQRALDAGELDE